MNKEAYITVQSTCGIEEGDIVRILRKAASNEMGWNDIWISDMDRIVGMTGEVASVGLRGIRVRTEGSGYGHNFPFFVLEKVSDAHTMVKENEMKFSLDWLAANEEILERFKKGQPLEVRSKRWKDVWAKVIAKSLDFEAYEYRLPQADIWVVVDSVGTPRAMFQNPSAARGACPSMHKVVHYVPAHNIEDSE